MCEISKLDQLIVAYESRARLIARSLSTRYFYVASERYVTHFVLLHTDHVRCLKSGDFTTAYNLLRSIGRLSHCLEEEELKLKNRAEEPHKRFKFRQERFRRGPIICGYVAGDFRQFSPKFDSTLSKILAEEPSILKIGTWSWSHGQRNAAEIYDRLSQYSYNAPEEAEVVENPLESRKSLPMMSLGR